MNNGIIERMKAASHIIVAEEIRQRGTAIRDRVAYRSSRIKQVYAEHQKMWRELYEQNPDIAPEDLARAVVVDVHLAPPPGQATASRQRAEANTARVREIMAEQADPELNSAGLAEARKALRWRAES